MPVNFVVQRYLHVSILDDTGPHGQIPNKMTYRTFVDERTSVLSDGTT